MRARLALLAALAVGASAPAVGAPAHSANHVIIVDQMTFRTTALVVAPGDTVTWVNNDIFQHSATARDHSFDLELKPKSRASVTLRKPGVIAFYCRYHPGMKGIITVRR